MSFAQGHALLIGVGTYRDAPGLDVPITAADAEAVAAVLRDPDFCGYPPDQVLVLRDRGATRGGILTALDQLAGNVGEDDTVFFFFCGHGDYGEDGDYYLTTHDTRVANGKVATGTGVRQAELIGKLRAIKAKRVLLLINACHSGQVSPVLGADVPQLSGHSLPSAAAAALLGTGEGRIIITACREEQVSYIGDGALTLFAQALVDGLRGKGTVSSRGFVSAFDLYTHLYFSVEEQVRTQFDQSQEPELTVLKGVGPFAVALFLGATELGPFDSSTSLQEGMATRMVPPAQAKAKLCQIIQAGDNSCANVSGSGASAKGPGAKAIGARSVQVGGNNSGSINTGTQINTEGGANIRGDVWAGGDFVGRDKILYGDQITAGTVRGFGNAIGHGAQAHVRSGVQPAQLTALFGRLAQIVSQRAPKEQQDAATRQVEAIQAEVSSPKPDKDSRLAKLIDGLAGMVPGAIGAIVSAFGSPLLAGIAGPATKAILEQLQGEGDASHDAGV